MQTWIKPFCFRSLLVFRFGSLSAVPSPDMGNCSCFEGAAAQQKAAAAKADAEVKKAPTTTGSILEGNFTTTDESMTEQAAGAVMNKLGSALAGSSLGRLFGAIKTELPGGLKKEMLGRK